MSELGKGQLTKTYINSYLYNVNSSQYEKRLLDFVMKGEEINKLDESFEDIRYEVKRRQVSSSLVKVLDSKNVVLISSPMPLPKAFKVFTAKDVKGDKKLKVFIDCDIIRKVNGKYVCNNIDIFIAYLVSAMNQFIYHIDPKRLIMRDEIISSGSRAFANLFTNIIDYLYKVSTVSSTRDKCLYLSSLYYQVNLLQKDITDSVKHNARKVSGISEREEEILLLQLDENSLDDINEFINSIARILKLSKLTLDAFVEKWIFLYGTGTQFALELYTAFATMITNAYVGCYINNQKTIEKIVGNGGKDMVAFTNAILKVGAESV